MHIELFTSKTMICGIFCETLQGMKWWDADGTLVSEVTAISESRADRASRCWVPRTGRETVRIRRGLLLRYLDGGSALTETWNAGNKATWARWIDMLWERNGAVQSQVSVEFRRDLDWRDLTIWWSGIDWSYIYKWECSKIKYVARGEKGQTLEI